jgi:hypothetical protein
MKREAERGSASASARVEGLEQGQERESGVF